MDVLFQFLCLCISFSFFFFFFLKIAFGRWPTTQSLKPELHLSFVASVRVGGDMLEATWAEACRGMSAKNFFSVLVHVICPSAQLWVGLGQISSSISLIWDLYTYITVAQVLVSDMGMCPAQVSDSTDSWNISMVLVQKNVLQTSNVTVSIPMSECEDLTWILVINWSVRVA